MQAKLMANKETQFGTDQAAKLRELASTLIGTYEEEKWGKDQAANLRKLANNPIDTYQEKSDVELINNPIDIYKGQFIEFGGFFPVIAKHNDTAYVFCRTNAGHLGRSGQITVLTSNNGIDWYKNGVIKKANSDVRNPSVFIFPNGELLVSAYKYNVYTEDGFASPELPSGRRKPLLFSSKNDGKTWQEKYSTFVNVLAKIGRFSPHGQMFFHQGKLMMPVYNQLGAFLLSSANKGKDWEIFSHIAKDVCEPSVVVMPNNELLAVLRACSRHQGSLISHYINNKWTEPIDITKRSQKPANLLTLSTGQILLTYGDRKAEQQRILARLSSDNGQTWSQPVQISETFKNCDFGYPSTIELKKGHLLTVFYASPAENPYFNFKNPDYYNNLKSAGYYYNYSLQELQKRSGQ